MCRYIHPPSHGSAVVSHSSFLSASTSPCFPLLLAHSWFSAIFVFCFLIHRTPSLPQPQVTFLLYPHLLRFFFLVTTTNFSLFPGYNHTPSLLVFIASSFSSFRFWVIFLEGASRAHNLFTHVAPPVWAHRAGVEALFCPAYCMDLRLFIILHTFLSLFGLGTYLHIGSICPRWAWMAVRTLTSSFPALHPFLLHAGFIVFLGPFSFSLFHTTSSLALSG